MKHIEDLKYEYAFRLGLADGRVAGRWITQGKTVDHGGLLGAYDAYAEGYRAGLREGRD